MAAVTMQLGVGSRGAAGSRRRPECSGARRAGSATQFVRSARVPAAVYWRRRAAALLLVAGAAASGSAALHALGGGPLAAAEAPRPTGGVHLATAPVSRSVYVVRAGDTLWTIARALQPSGDVRPLVDALAEGRSGRPLQPGERIALP